MPCSETNPVKTCYGRGAQATKLWGSASATNDRWLVVSDYPETLEDNFPREAPGDPVVPIPYPSQLYRCTIPLQGDQTPTKVRLLLWHLNASSATKYFKIVLRLKTLAADIPSASVSDHRSEFRVQQDIAATGVCLAKVHLFGGNNWVSRNGGTIPADGTDFDLPTGQNGASPNSYEVAKAGGLNNGFIGAVHEFEVALDEATTELVELEIRTVVTDSESNNGPHSLEPISYYKEDHIRGRWPYSDIEVASDEGEVDFINPTGRIAFRISQVTPPGKDYAMFTKQVGDEFGTSKGNRGLYGVNATYVIKGRNNSGTSQVLEGLIWPSETIPDGDEQGETVEHYLGAIERDLSPPQVGVQPLRKYPGNNGNPPPCWEAVKIVDDMAILPDEVVEYKIPNAVGGSAWLPGELIFSWIGYEEVEDPE